MSRVRRAAHARRSDTHVMAGKRFPRRRLAAVVVLAASLLTGGGVALVDGASARPGDNRPDTATVGRNWHTARQDARPNERAQEPADRGARQSPEERLEQVRPAGDTGTPQRVPSTGMHAPVTDENVE